MFLGGVIGGFLSFMGSGTFAVGYIANNSLFPEALSSEEEKKYIQMMSKGDEEARNILIEHNLRLVAHVCKKYANSNVDQDDLISIGSIGLIKGINSYDVHKNIKLSTYISKCIDNEILMYLRSKKKTNKEVSLYEPLGIDKEGNEIQLYDIIETNEDDASDRIVLKQNIQKLYEELESLLTPRERLVLKMRYGLYNGEEYTQREVARQLGISRSYVSRIEKSAIQKLRSSFFTSQTVK